MSLHFTRRIQDNKNKNNKNKNKNKNKQTNKTKQKPITMGVRRKKCKRFL